MNLDFITGPMDGLMLVVVFGLLCMGVGGIAKLTGREFTRWTAVAAICSPVLTFAVLFLAVLIRPRQRKSDDVLNYVAN